MNSSDRPIPRVHGDVVFFREAVAFTAAQTAFSQRLVEKDYFCTVLLAYLASAKGSPLVFKGGTCLAKIHAEFYFRVPGFRNLGSCSTGAMQHRHRCGTGATFTITQLSARECSGREFSWAEHGLRAATTIQQI